MKSTTYIPNPIADQKRTETVFTFDALKAQEHGPDEQIVTLTPFGVVAIGRIGAYIAQNFERVCTPLVDTFRRVRRAA